MQGTDFNEEFSEAAPDRNYRERRSYPGAETSNPEFRWNKRHLALLYEDINYNKVGVDSSRIQELLRGRTTVLSTKVVETYCWDRLPVINYEVPKQPVFGTHTYLWVTKNKRNIVSKEGREKLSEHLSNCNPHFPYLYGLQHHNRFKRGIKVYIVEGLFLGRHGTVVGHLAGFDITNDRAPVLKILTVDSRNRLEVVNILQHLVKIIDFHQQIDFAIPTLSQHTLPTTTTNFN